jgi:shikimate kinase
MQNSFTEQGTINIVLIGMPGSGKSSIGIKLAEILSYQFVDTDALIEKSLGQTLQDFLDREGYLALRRVEEETILSFNAIRYVVATGGEARFTVLRPWRI